MTETETELDQTFKFEDLSEAAKSKARDKYRESEYPSYPWWDDMYEGFGEAAVILGIDLITRRYTKTGKAFNEHDISFSGFYSQGDGASFKGSYRNNPLCLEQMREHCNDPELIRIASELLILQIARRLHGLAPFSAEITTSGRYSHSNTMDVTVNSEDEDDEHNQVGEELEEKVTQLMRDFADWIYKSLEDEYDYLMSDDVIDEQLADNVTMFYIDGTES